MEPCRSRQDHSSPVVDCRHLLGSGQRPRWRWLGWTSPCLPPCEPMLKLFGEGSPVCEVGPTHALEKETVLARRGGRTVPRTLLGAAPGTQMVVLMLEPFPSLHPRRRRGWRQGCAGQAGCQAAPPASILLFLLLFLPSWGWWELWLLSSSTGRCSLQEKSLA